MSPLLFLLSTIVKYSHKEHFSMAMRMGFEPMVSAVTGQRIWPAMLMHLSVGLPFDLVDSYKHDYDRC